MKESRFKRLDGFKAKHGRVYHLKWGGPEVGLLCGREDRTCDDLRQKWWRIPEDMRCPRCAAVLADASKLVVGGVERVERVHDAMIEEISAESFPFMPKSERMRIARAVLAAADGREP